MIHEDSIGYMDCCLLKIKVILTYKCMIHEDIGLCGLLSTEDINAYMDCCILKIKVITNLCIHEYIIGTRELMSTEDKSNTNLCQ